MKTTFKIGMFYTAIGQYSNIFIQLLINVVLSRLISVEDFGIVANVQVFLLFFQMLVMAGFGPAIIQNKNLNEDDYGVIFNYTVIFAMVMSICFGIFGYAIAYLYHNSIYVKLFWFMSIIIFSEGMNVVPTAILNKELRFKTLNMRVLICNSIGAVFGIISAFLGFGVYALIVSVAIPAVATLIANFAVVKIKYTIRMDKKPIKSIWKFARNQLSFTVINYFSRNSDNLLIGKFLGPSPLANYQKSYQLITMPNTVFLGIVSPVLQPVLSKHEDNVELIRETYLRLVHALALLAFPFTIFMIFNSKNIILFLFGQEWYAAIMPLQILSFSIWAQMLTSATGSIFMARNHSHTLLRTGVISMFIIVPLTIIGVLTKNINLVALFICIAYIFNFFTSYWILMKKVLFGNMNMVLKELCTPVSIGGVVALAMIFSNTLFSIFSPFISLLVNGLICLFSFLVGITLFGEWLKIKNIFL